MIVGVGVTVAVGKGTAVAVAEGTGVGLGSIGLKQPVSNNTVSIRQGTIVDLGMWLII